MVAIGNDHSGIEMKQAIMKYFDEINMDYIDLGTNSKDSCDYPDFAKKVVNAIKEGQCDKGVLICGTGIGISIAANRVGGIRCAVCNDVFSSKASREHNDANILAMGARVIGIGHCLEIVKAFFATGFSKDPRHIKRIDKLEILEGK